MKVHLVRHSKAEKRSSWDGPGELRPLTALGLRQARALARHLADSGAERIVAGPDLRCRQTLEPLAQALGLRVEVLGCLAKGEDPEKAATVLRELGSATVVCCSHADLVADLAGELDAPGTVVRVPPQEADQPNGESQRLAVLDMGSTSFHMLVADVTSSGSLLPVDRERRMLRLGAVIESHGHIPSGARARALDAARALRAKARKVGAERILPVGTAALRDADNGAEVALEIERALGLPVQILSGEEEARVIFAAFRRRVLLPRDAVTLGVDLGGGSLELAIGDQREVHWERTSGLGVAALHRALVKADPMRRKDGRRVTRQVERELEVFRGDIERFSPALCVAAGGTARALGHLAVGLRGMRPGTVNQVEIPAPELAALSDLLVASTHRQRLGLPGMRRRRADLLPTGVLILRTLVEVLGLDGLTLSDWGLREGILLEAVRAHEPAALAGSRGTREAC